MFGPSFHLAVELVWPLLTSDPSRRRLLAGALCGLHGALLSSLVRGWQPAATPGPFASSAPSGINHAIPHRHADQISPGKNAMFPRTSAAFTVGPVPMGFAVMCQLASVPSAFYAVSVRRLARLHSGFLQTSPRELALAFG
jgi:hypothetical protein